MTPFAVLGGIMVLAVPINVCILPRLDGKCGTAVNALKESHMSVIDLQSFNDTVDFFVLMSLKRD